MNLEDRSRLEEFRANTRNRPFCRNYCINGLHIKAF
jgi:hypothetical protein